MRSSSLNGDILSSSDASRIMSGSLHACTSLGDRQVNVDIMKGHILIAILDVFGSASTNTSTLLLLII